ncbi:MAG: endoribonuclease MazF [Planctomycetia bacterium]|nr:endoribonuclease MazF [Planctomycetia bacterium]
MAGYVPDRGDFVWIDLNPRQGREQSGHRPALVISPKAYNRKTSLCVVCPATRQAKGYPFEVSVCTADGSTSVILADHVRSVDWKTRRVRRIDTVSEDVLGEVVGRLEALLINPDC